MSDKLRNRIREIVQEELENMFSTDSDGDNLPDTEEMRDSLDQEVKRKEDEINQRKKTVNISKEIDPQLATKDKMLKKQQLDQLEDRLKQDEENLDMIDQLDKNIKDYKASLADTSTDIDSGVEDERL